MRLVTHSEISCFRRCRREWYLTYLRGLAPERDDPTSLTGLGNLTHEALEIHYDPDDERDPIAYVHGCIEAAVEAEPEREHEIRNRTELVVAMVEGYFEWLAETGADEDLEVVGQPETAVQAPLGTIRGREVALLGKLDLRVRRRSDGARMFMDHKTVSNFADPINGLDRNTQPKHYLLLERLTLPEGERPCDGAIWNMLRRVKRTARAKPPFFERAEVRHNDETLRSYYLSVWGTVERMLEAEDALRERDHLRVAPPSPDRYCSWGCDFSDICSMFDDGSDVESVIRSSYSERDPLARYNDDTPEAA